jgi:hypothetical protein
MKAAMAKGFTALLLAFTWLGLLAPLQAWGVQGHRLVAQVASGRLTAVAQQHVRWLLPDRSLADVSAWADDYRVDNAGTAAWHFVNIPEGATYDRDRDCPRQPGANAGTRADRWRDCVVDRILYHQAVLRDVNTDRAERATSLKFLVHFVGDIHQPFHAVAVQAGGNGIPVVFFGSRLCPSPVNANAACQLHGVWDTQLIARRDMTDAKYLEELKRLIVMRRLDQRMRGTPADWANESLALGHGALVARDAAIDQAYFQKHIGTVDERLALGGVRLAALLNDSLTTSPPR